MMRPRTRLKTTCLFEFIYFAVLVIYADAVRTVVLTTAGTFLDAIRFESFSAGSALNAFASHLRSLRKDLERLGPSAPLRSPRVRLRDLQRRNPSG